MSDKKDPSEQGGGASPNDKSDRNTLKTTAPKAGARKEAKPPPSPEKGPVEKGPAAKAAMQKGSVEPLSSEKGPIAKRPVEKAANMPGVAKDAQSKAGQVKNNQVKNNQGKDNQAVGGRMPGKQGPEMAAKDLKAAPEDGSTLKVAISDQERRRIMASDAQKDGGGQEADAPPPAEKDNAPSEAAPDGDGGDPRGGRGRGQDRPGQDRSGQDRPGQDRPGQDRRGRRGARRGRDDGRPRQDRGEEDDYIDRLVSINRVAKVVKGGRRFGFSALIVVGDGAGKVGCASGKAREISEAIRKATERAKRKMIKVPLREGRTLHHDVQGHHGGGKVILRAAPTGTGIIAGGPMRAIFEALGVQDVVAKSLGSSNPHNMVRATFDAFTRILSPRLVASKRGRSIRDIVKERVA